MKKFLAITLFMLATLAWAAAQQPGTPNSQAPTSGQSQASRPGSSGQDTTQNGKQPGSQGQVANAPVTEGCLGGTAPNFTITDKAGTTYKLNIPPSADTSKLASHVGEPVQVLGNVNTADKPGNASIDVQGIGRATGKCPGSGSSSGSQTPPKQ
jgi:hypothetical protein